MDKTFVLPKKLKDLRVGVLAGGSSGEREISLESGRAVSEALREAGLEVLFFDIRSIEDLEELSADDMNIAFIALHGGFGEDGTAQKLLEVKGIAYTGSGPKASKKAMDKVTSKEIFCRNGLTVPLTYKLSGDNPYIFDGVKYPCVIKPVCGGSSQGLEIIHSPIQIKKILGDVNFSKENVFAEEFIEGREITVGVVRDKALPAVEICATGEVYDFGAKYLSCDTKYVVPADIPKKTALKAREDAVIAHKALGCQSFSRADFRLSNEGKLFILEVNTIPGLTKRSLLPKAAAGSGLDFIRLCVNMLEDGLEIRREIMHSMKDV